MPNYLRRPLQLVHCENCFDRYAAGGAHVAEVTLSGVQTWTAPIANYSKQAASLLHEEVVGPGHHDPTFRLFRDEDAFEWVVFTLVFIALVLFDNFVLHREQKVLSFSKACVYTFFWILCAAAFNLYVYVDFGADAAFTWATGYLLEWMLSLDNLFVFHLVFRIYKTPDNFKHKPLFYGIIGAIVFRMLFFVIGETLFHSVWWMHLVLGAFLVYTGLRAVITDDDDEDPIVFRWTEWLSQRLPLVNKYDSEGSFFVRVQVDDKPTPRSPASSHERFRSLDADGVPVPPHTNPPEMKSRYNGTILVLVVICLELTDIIFAVDSVSAIVAQIPDLFLAYTACVFAMLGLRATYFIIDELIRCFVLLKYGVGAILVFIGAKLMASKHLDMSNGAVLIVLVATVGACVIGSMIYDRFKEPSDADSSKTDSSKDPESSV